MILFEFLVDSIIKDVSFLVFVIFSLKKRSGMLYISKKKIILV